MSFCQTYARPGNHPLYRSGANKDEPPVIHVGDTVKVGVIIQEGGKERTQPYEGVVIAKKGAGINQNITVRRTFQGVGVERVFLIHSPALKVSKSCVEVRYGAPNFTICVIVLVRLLASSSDSIGHFRRLFAKRYKLLVDL